VPTPAPVGRRTISTPARQGAARSSVERRAAR
jgi:hypothetical protein